MQLPALIEKKIIRGNKPDASICRSAHSENGIASRRPKRIDPALRIDSRSPFRRQRQHRAVSVRCHVQDARRGKTAIDPKSFEAATRLTQQAVGSANPQSIPSVLRQATDIVAGKGRFAGLLKDPEVQPIKSREPTLGSNPQKTIVRLQNRVDTILRQAIPGRP
jgi:hypothetical protein